MDEEEYHESVPEEEYDLFEIDEFYVSPPEESINPPEGEYLEQPEEEYHRSFEEAYHTPKEEYNECLEEEEAHAGPIGLSDQEKLQIFADKAAKLTEVKEDLIGLDKQIKRFPLTPRQQKIIGKHKLTPTGLKTGFGIHTKRSLELALIAADRAPHICKCTVCEADTSSTSTSEQESSERTTSTLSGNTYAQQVAAERLKYLMGLQEAEEESYEIAEGIPEEIQAPEENLINGLTENMRNAQNYLREHRIFEFFQFLCAHLLSAKPYDPIEFLVNLLDKCMVYRSGIYAPPLLYDKKHINRLFFLMDRMGTGFIDYNQYKTGMFTFGIKSFNNNPPRNAEGLIPRNFFVEEAYECLKDLLNDILRRRPRKPAKPKKKMPKAPPPSAIPLIWPEKNECKSKPYF